MTDDRDLALRCRGVSKRFGRTIAVDDLDLDVPRGTVTALLGPSGCGKTTALRLVAGLEVPDAGTIEIHGREVAGPDGAVPPERRRIGMVFQDYALFPHLDVVGNVAYGLTGDRSARRRRALGALELVGLAHLADRTVTALSGGQQQRVALARALAPEPELVLLDEPFSNLDAALRATVREDVREILRAAGATAVFVTHDQEEALSLADEVAVMTDGRIHQVAPPDVLYQHPATRFVAEFVGDADVLPGRRAGQYLVDTSVGRLRTRERVDSDEAAVVIRPEALHLSTRGEGNATVDAVTYFGHDQLVAVRLDDGTVLRSRQGPGLRVDRGDRVRTEVHGSVVVFPG
jgi:iron(III) transport system ATP-binding protein